MKKVLHFTLIVFIGCLISCSYTQSIQDGRSAYRLKQYSVATEYLSKEYASTKNREEKGELAYLAGQSYIAMNNDTEALKWHQKAVDQGYGRKALVALGYSLKSQENYQGAVAQFEKAQTQFGTDPAITREIAICKQAIYYVDPDGAGQYTIEVDDATFNSASADYSPILYGDDQIVFTTDRSNANGDATYNWTGNSFSDIFIVNKRGGDAQSFDPIINTDNNEGTPCFTKDLQRIYFTRCFDSADADAFCKLMYSDMVDEAWSEPQVLDFVSAGLNYGHPALIENDEVMVFTIETPGGATGYDLYYSVYIDKEWSQPEAMPTSINTQGDEKFATSDGDTLYFSSNYLPGLGGFDIFKTYLLEDKRWAPPYNIKSPYNSGADDFGLVIDRTLRPSGRVLETGYFSSSRDSKMGDQIYKYEKQVLADTEISTEPKDTVPDIKQSIYLAGRIVENIYNVLDDPNSGINKKEALANANVELNIAGTNIKLRSDDKGRFLEEISVDKDFVVKAKMPGYLSNSKSGTSKNIDIPDGEEVYTINIELALDKLVKNKEILLDNILYDFDRWDIRDDAKPSLNELAKILGDNPEINIQLASHTDCQGNNAYNQNLSQKRAQSAVRYLMTTGINPKRLKAKGYGESRLADTCECDDCTDDQHQVNRRTTFTILE